MRLTGNLVQTFSKAQQKAGRNWNGSNKDLALVLISAYISLIRGRSTYFLRSSELRGKKWREHNISLFAAFANTFERRSTHAVFHPLYIDSPISGSLNNADDDDGNQIKRAKT
jgi:hypothetical protein